MLWKSPLLQHPGKAGSGRRHNNPCRRVFLLIRMSAGWNPCWLVSLAMRILPTRITPIKNPPYRFGSCLNLGGLLAPPLGIEPRTNLSKTEIAEALCNYLISLIKAWNYNACSDLHLLAPWGVLRRLPIKKSGKSREKRFLAAHSCHSLPFQTGIKLLSLVSEKSLEKVRLYLWFYGRALKP